MTSRIPPSRRAPEFAPERVAKAVSVRVPGTGRVAAASTVLPAQVQTMLRAKPSSSTTTESVLFAFDRYPSSGTLSGAVTVLTMRYAAMSGSVHVYLNGFALDEGFDYTTVGNTVSLATGIAGSGDVVVVRYAYLDGAVAGSAGSSGEASSTEPRYVIAGNKGGLASGFTDGITHLPLDRAVASSQIDCHCVSGSRNVAAALWTAPSTFLTVAVLNVDVIVRKYEVVGGVVTGTTLATAFFTAPTDFTVKIRKSGNDVYGSVDGVDRVSYTLTGSDITTYASPVGVGVVAVGSSGLTFDNLYADDELVDTFNRPDAPALGQASNGRYWVDYS